MSDRMKLMLRYVPVSDHAGPFCAALCLIALIGTVVTAAPPEVNTDPATPLGTTGLSANGRIQPHGAPTTWHFEYGTSVEYGMKTPPEPLPPRLAAYYHENWDGGLSGWTGGMSGKDLTVHPEGGASGGFVRFSEPSGDDPNHVDGIGTLHLSTYFYPAMHPNQEGSVAAWGGGVPDVRDARVKMHVRGNNWIPHGSELVWWTQSEKLLAERFTPNWRRANWAHTGFSLNSFLNSGQWEVVDYRLVNSTHAWTYGGHNVSQNRPNYVYWPIGSSLANVSCDFFHLLAFVDPKNRPTGSIDFDEFEVAYRNYSLVIPSNGGKLVSGPPGSDDDPATLTDGWRHGKGRMWKSAADPAVPQEFTWSFERPVTIQTVQIHQNPEWPGREVEVLVSDDGQNWNSILRRTLPKNTPNGPNFASVLESGLSAPARYARVRILSGYQSQHWGLGEVEFFGTGAEMRTDDDWYHVNLDFTDLRPGQKYHYRLVATSAVGTTTGNDQTFQVPADTKPHVVTAAASRVTGTSARLEGRLTPMGIKTEFHFEYGTSANYGQKTAVQYGGLQITPRSAYATLDGLRPSTTYHYRLVGVNASGTVSGDDMEFRTE